MRILLSILFLLCANSFIFAQDTMTTTTPAPTSVRDSVSQFNSWYTIQGNTKIAKDYSLFHDLQIRRNGFLEDEQQNMFRFGLQRALSKKHSIMIGYAYVDSVPYGKQPIVHAFNEHRSFLQFLTKQKIGNTQTLFHRYRVEQRSLQDQKDLNGDRIYQNRIRYMLRFNLPLITDGPLPISLNLYDEVFINVGEEVKFNLLDQNRLGLNFNFKVSKHLSLEFGYMLQTLIKGKLNDQNLQPMEQNHTMTVALITDLSLID